MLRDLDRRRASDAERSNVPSEVRPLPADASAKRSRMPLIAGLGLVVAGAVWFALPLLMDQPDTPPQVLASTAQVTTPKVGAGDTAVVAVPAVPAPVVPATAVPAADTPTPSVTPSPAPVATPAPAPSIEPPKAESRKEPVKNDEAKKAVPEKPVRDAAGGKLKLDSRLSLSSMVPRSEAVPAPVVADASAPGRAPDSADSEVQRAEGLLRQGVSKEAEVRLRRVLEKSPEHIAGRQALINLLLTAKRSEDATIVLQEGLAKHPAQTPWAMNLARLQADRNDYAAAWESLSRSLPHAQQQPDYRAFCGAVLQRLNRPREAAENYRAALTIKPTEGRWWVGFGLALEGERQMPEAKEAFQRARQVGNLPPELSAFVDQKLR